MDDPEPYVQNLALCVIGNISSVDMARDMAPEMERLLTCPNPYIRKKVALCVVRIFRKVPDLIDNFIEHIANLFNEKNHGVLVGVTRMALEAVELQPRHIPFFRRVLYVVMDMTWHVATRKSIAGC